MTELDAKVVPNSLWRHRNGAMYKVLFLTNELNTEQYPLTVVYEGRGNGKRWSRPLADWHRSMTFVSY